MTSPQRLCIALSVCTETTNFKARLHCPRRMTPSTRPSSSSVCMFLSKMIVVRNETNPESMSGRPSVCNVLSSTLTPQHRQVNLFPPQRECTYLRREKNGIRIGWHAKCGTSVRGAVRRHRKAPHRYFAFLFADPFDFEK